MQFAVGCTLIIECLLFVIGVFHPCCSGFLVKRVINGELGERKVAISKYIHTHRWYSRFNIVEFSVSLPFGKCLLWRYNIINDRLGERKK